MIALDTNIITRYLLNDDPMQAQAAVTLLGSGEPLFVPTTVWLELAWVLGCYDCTRAEIAGAVRHVLGLPNLQTMDEIALLRALAGYEGGLDFADALHLALSSGTGSMASFDKDFAKIAKRLEMQPPVVRPMP
ncbi:type II toxin-antitoxin system VapC family toxin [uncultured Thiodictyon sp.]|uniref:type II toxin-antitoxin system VapC family toxin n=1 Tax=uncultured Thiodictyon sp. TaxID=1846217 RepID=UPI0025E48871|nr:type II toxin-antitoxin system VapC family toxin [uncultured Thiodictyon sp.]